MSKTIHRHGLLSSTPAPVKRHRPPPVPKVVWSKPPTRQVNRQRMKGLLG